MQVAGDLSEGVSGPFLMPPLPMICIHHGCLPLWEHATHSTGDWVGADLPRRGWMGVLTPGRGGGGGVSEQHGVLGVDGGSFTARLTTLLDYSML